MGTLTKVIITYIIRDIEKSTSQKGELTMSIKAILFDLDGTLLPMDQDVFVKTYFGGIAKKLAPHGYDPEKLIQSIWSGTSAMIKNSGEKLNEDVFWDDFVSFFGEKSREDISLFESFYENDFDQVQQVCGYNPKSAEIINKLKEMGLRVALATNPIFPEIATRKRMKWAGLTPDMFELYTTYENSRYCKPNLAYYKEIIKQMGVAPEECLMVGNDVGDDMVVSELGMKVFLLTNDLINKQNVDINQFPHGDFNELMKYIGEI